MISMENFSSRRPVASSATAADILNLVLCNADADPTETGA